MLEKLLDDFRWCRHDVGAELRRLYDVHGMADAGDQDLGLEIILVVDLANIGNQLHPVLPDVVQFVAPQIVDKALNGVDGVEMRNVGRGHPLFGPACSLIRSEALVRIDADRPLPYGLLVLGQRSEQKLDGRHGSELLLFLGNGLAAMIRRWLINSTT